LSKNFLESLYKIKKYDAGLKELNKYFNDHQKFLKQFKNEINLHITDKEFPQRLELSYQKVKEWLTDQNIKN